MKGVSLVQVAQLAETGRDRATRVAACEFLHAVTLWMVGAPSLLGVVLSVHLACSFPLMSPHER